MSLYEALIRPLFFHLDPETAHHVVMEGLRLAGSFPFTLPVLSTLNHRSDPRLQTELFGLHFPNPIGLAAGFDKDAQAMRELAALGFGHVEVGTVTVLPQPGNPRPRITRYPNEKAIINRMGFPNRGVERIAKRLERLGHWGQRVPVGVNIGKGVNTPLETAVEDYSELLRRLHAYVDFVAINISSPNTPGLRGLQSKNALLELLGELAALWCSICPNVPLLVKIAPDLSYAEIDDVLDVMTSFGMSGIIATNSSTGRQGLPHRAARQEKGGMSGPPLRALSTDIIRHIYRATGGSLPIIGVGGIDSAESALEKIQAGASLVQVYTGLIYRGPGLLRSINRGLAQRVSELGATNLAELVGRDAVPKRFRPRRQVPAPAPVPLSARFVPNYHQFGRVPRQRARE
jgi:dihydroorotate dehydrogenase